MAKKYLTVKKLRHLKYIYISKNKRQSILDMDPSFYEKFMYVMHWFIFAVDRLGLRRHQKIYYYKSWKRTPNNTAVLQVSTYVVVDIHIIISTKMSVSTWYLHDCTSC